MRSSMQSAFEAMSRRNDEPSTACRPFDTSRDGTVMGEAAAVLCFEDISHAQKRGAEPIAELAGFGSAFDRDWSGKGLARAKALLDAPAKKETAGSPTSPWQGVERRIERGLLRREAEELLCAR